MASSAQPGDGPSLAGAAVACDGADAAGRASARAAQHGAPQHGDAQHGAARHRARLQGRWWLGLVVLGLFLGGVLLQPSLPPGTASLDAWGDRVLARLEARRQALDLSDQQRLWERIGWIRDVDEALELAARHHRPLFAFSLNGRLDGRC